MKSAYRILTWLISPFVMLWLLWRMQNGKEDRNRLPERFGSPKHVRQKGRLIWLHAASVGEANSAVPLLTRLHELHKDCHFLLTTGTVTSWQVIAPKLPERAVHQFVPVDLPWCVSSFLNHWKPDLAIWVESELWPNLIWQTHKRHIPMTLVNARLSDRSQHRWRRMQSFYLSMMSCFSLVYAGSEADKRKLTELGVKTVRYAGNLKYDVAPLSNDPQIMEALRSVFGSRPVWLAASTHPGEELYIARAHQAVKATFPDLLTIIVPRHPHRGIEITQQLAALSLSLCCRSKNEVPTQNCEIYIADTLGELGNFYRLCGIVFIGGSLVDCGGHNPIEPAQLDCAIICGPYMYNFQEIAHELMINQALIQIQNEQELSKQIIELLQDLPRQSHYASAARLAAAAQQGVVEHISSDLHSLLAIHKSGH